MKLIPRRLAAKAWYTGIRSLVPTGSRVGPRSDSVALPPVPTTLTLTLKLFRRERAISTFDDTFNPPHRSSPSFSTLVSSVLHGRLRLAFTSAPRQNRLTWLVTVSRRIIMQKARRQALRLPAIALRPLVGMWFQVQCPPLVGVLPIFRSRYLSTIGR